MTCLAASLHFNAWELHGTYLSWHSKRAGVQMHGTNTDLPHEDNNYHIQKQFDYTPVLDRQGMDKPHFPRFTGRCHVSVYHSYST
eukprot:654127-Amphidinium_carterae.1